MKPGLAAVALVTALLSAACQLAALTTPPTPIGQLETQVTTQPPDNQTSTAAVRQAGQLTLTAAVPSPSGTLPASPSPNPTSTAVPPSMTSAPTAATITEVQATTMPPTTTPFATVTNCPTLPQSGFLIIWQSSADLQASLGCPTSFHPRIMPEAWEVKTSYQLFEDGAMLWSDHLGWYAQPVVYVLYSNSTFDRFDDHFEPGVDPVEGSEQPPSGLVEPLFGFGKVWRDQAGVQESLGWATTSETPGVGRFQMFEEGEMIWISQTNQTYVFSRWGSNLVSTFDIPFSP